jgi:hypothetical protein
MGILSSQIVYAHRNMIGGRAVLTLKSSVHQSGEGTSNFLDLVEKLS